MQLLDFLDESTSEVNKRKEKFETWLAQLPRWHNHFTFTPCLHTYWTVPKKPISKSRIAFVSTAGVHLKNQLPFDINNPDGDCTYRIIPSETSAEELMVSDSHYDHSDADTDINCIFGLHRLHELAGEGVIGEVAPRHFGLMGFIPDPTELLEKTAPEVARLLAADEVDVVLLTPG